MHTIFCVPEISSIFQHTTCTAPRRNIWFGIAHSTDRDKDSVALAQAVFWARGSHTCWDGSIVYIRKIICSHKGNTYM